MLQIIYIYTIIKFGHDVTSKFIRDVANLLQITRNLNLQCIKPSILWIFVTGEINDATHLPAIFSLII